MIVSTRKSTICVKLRLGQSMSADKVDNGSHRLRKDAKRRKRKRRR